MRIALSQEIIPVAPNIGEQLLIDAHFLYGGDLFDNGGDLRYTSHDRLVEGWFGENPDKEEPSVEAGIAFTELDTPLQARRWVAAHAYLQLAGQQPTPAIALESDLALLLSEWQASKHVDNPEFVVSSLEGKIILTSMGANVIDAACRLAEGYKDLDTLATDDPQRQVAQALGAPSLAVLRRTWELSQKTSEPRVAARFVLNNLGLAID